jgi:uncharacterized protein YoxC
VSVWSEVFLGVIALATLTMAIGLVGVLLAASRLARQVGRFLDQLESDLRPVLGHLNAIGRDASRAASLATAQVERVDRLVTDLGLRLDDAFQSFQATLSGPAREGFAVLSAIAAAIRALRETRAGRARTEEDDALFI